MASTGSVRRDFGFAEQAIEVVAHHRFVLTALLKQESRQGLLHQPVLVPLGVLFDESHHGVE